MAPEKRLIDFETARKNVMNILAGKVSTPVAVRVSVAMQEATVDAVEVVRCKDCKHSIWDEEEQMWECVLAVNLTGDLDTYSMFHEYNDGEHFCSYGERKDNV